MDEARLAGHVVIVGYGRVGRHITSLMERMGIPFLVVDADSNRIEELTQQGARALYGDAANSEVLTHAGLVMPAPWWSPARMNLPANWLWLRRATWRPMLPIIARATTVEGIRGLTQLGAQSVIHPELEGGLEIVRHTLLLLDFPQVEIDRYTDAVRADHYDLEFNTDAEQRVLQELIHAAKNVEVSWLQIPAGHPLVGQSLAQADIRAKTGASVVGILREDRLLGNPKSSMVFEAGDREGLIGEKEKLAGWGNNGSLEQDKTDLDSKINESWLRF